MKKRLEIIQCEWHRNGICGAGFHAILFDWTEDGRTRRMVATLFDKPGHCALLEVSQLSEESGVTFGRNSWRGDHFENELRRLVKKHTKNKIGPFSMIPM